MEAITGGDVAGIRYKKEKVKGVNVSFLLTFDELG